MTSEGDAGLRYSRLNALTSFGYDVDFEDLRSKRVVVVGVGGVGSLSAEMLARCGVGHIVVMDLDVVGEENLNRVFYKSHHVGRYKAEVCAEVLRDVNPDITVEHYHTDIMSPTFEPTFEHLIRAADLVMQGLDNVPARQYLNVKCVELNTPLMDAGALRSGLGGYVHLVIPGETACYQCVGSVKIQKKANDARGPQCAASLPTTIAMISAMQTQQALKFLLGFGKRADFINYNGLGDMFHVLTLPRDPHCYVCGQPTSADELSELWVDLDQEAGEVEQLMRSLDVKEMEIAEEEVRKKEQLGS